MKNCVQRLRLQATISFSATFAVVMFAAAGLVSAQAPADGPAPTDRTARYEIDFMTGMSDHHYMAIQMSEMCLEKAIHPELQEMCQQIITTQQQETSQMQAWLSEWYSINYQPQMDNGGMRMIEKLAQAEGGEFEIAFMRMMIRHHFGAIREASKCVDRVYHDELHEMCEEIIIAQAEEIETMRSWLCTWYGICGGRPAP